LRHFVYRRLRNGVPQGESVFFRLKTHDYDCNTNDIQTPKYDFSCVRGEKYTTTPATKSCDISRKDGRGTTGLLNTGGLHPPCFPFAPQRVTRSGEGRGSWAGWSTICSICGDPSCPYCGPHTVLGTNWSPPRRMRVFH
jgi:hypothetical protein